MPLPPTEIAATGDVVQPDDQWISKGFIDTVPFPASYLNWLFQNFVGLTVRATSAAFETLAVGGGYGSTGLSVDASGNLQTNGTGLFGGALSAASAALTGALTAASAVIGGGYTLAGSGSTFDSAGNGLLNGDLLADGDLNIGGRADVLGDAQIDGALTVINLVTGLGYLFGAAEPVSVLFHLGGKGALHTKTVAGGDVDAARSGDLTSISMAVTTGTGAAGAGGSGSVLVSLDVSPVFASGRDIVVEDAMTLYGVLVSDMDVRLRVYALNATSGAVAGMWEHATITGMALGNVVLTRAAGDYAPATSGNGQTYLLEIAYASSSAVLGGITHIASLQIDGTKLKIK